MTAGELAGLVAAWPVGSGTNNLSRFVEAANGRFFLRVYQNATDAGQVGFEQALLRELAGAALPFRVPEPLPSRDGRTVVPALDRRLAALFRVLPGERLDRRPEPRPATRRDL
ncbi:MAG TPA: phosphotransferase [Chloroflexota bacterium]|nr:phosphotransferase [Chloroflexota bacterium]